MQDTKINTRLGELQEVELRAFWSDEAKDFTPWLAEDQNIELLSKCLGLEIEVIEIEKSIGNFKADILAKDSQNDQIIIIENQLEKTNHTHLGQIITYAAGVDASYIIWIAKRFSEEHRQAIDWLNEKTTEDLGIFGIEIQLWKIDNSSPAPHFKVIAQPNTWAKTLKQKRNDPQGFSGTKLLQYQFWSAFKEYAEENKAPFRTRKASPQHWYEISVEKSGAHISLTLNSREKKVGCALIITNSQKTSFFENLHKQKDSIEKELENKVEWMELPNNKSSKIIQYHPFDFTDQDKWPELFQWFLERSKTFHRVFSKRLNK